MTLEEYIEKNYSEKQLNENFSYFSGWHEAILGVVRETWKAAQPLRAVDAAKVCPECGSLVEFCAMGHYVPSAPRT